MVSKESQQRLAHALMGPCRPVLNQVDVCKA